jgi:CubicO group peptidase (beta-lactamase class C family)
MNIDLIRQAAHFAIEHETAWSREPGDAWGIHHQDPAPWNRLLGPVHARGPVSGTILVNGTRIHSWGEPERPDLTFSIAKTYLALLAGVAHDQALLPDVTEPVRIRVRGIGFDSGRNAEVTWEQLLQQTSEWEGECSGVPDRVDRYRSLQFLRASPAGKKGDARPLQKPGAYWEYNDVRVNQLALALLHLFKRPLPDVFRSRIMQPIGASDRWRWEGYDNAWVEIEGRRMQSVPGGTHWGAGVSIGSHDQALVGQLLLDEGTALGKRVLSPQWIRRMLTPCDIAPFYGYLTWLNRERRMFPSLPASSYFAIGAGSSYTWVEPERRIVAVVRWIDSQYAEEFFAQILRAVDLR